MTEPRAILIVGVLGVLVGMVTYYLTETAKREQDEYVRREERYKGMLESLEAFRVSDPDSEDVAKAYAGREAFLNELNKCWLYCPDNVIKSGYAFLETVKVGAGLQEEQRRAAFANLLLEIRHDLLSRKAVTTTALQATDYRLFKPNLPKQTKP